MRLLQQNRCGFPRILAGYAVGILPRGGGGPIAPGPPQRGGQRTPVRLATAQIFQPLLVDADGGSAPRALQPGVKLAKRKTSDEMLAAIEQSALAECGRDRRRFAVEIIQRQARIIVTLAPQVAADVAAVFAQQRHRLVFRMALEEEVKALVLPREHVDAGDRRAGENAV